MQEQALNSIDPKILGGRLQEARKSRGLTQQSVADEMEVARTTVVAIEKGERRLTPHELIKLAALYGRSVSDFVSRQFVVEAYVPQFRAALGVAESHESGLEEASELQVLAENYVELERILGMSMPKAYPHTYSESGASAEQVAEEIATNERNRLGIGDGPLGIFVSDWRMTWACEYFTFRCQQRLLACFSTMIYSAVALVLTPSTLAIDGTGRSATSMAIS